MSPDSLGERSRVWPSHPALPNLWDSGPLASAPVFLLTGLAWPFRPGISFSIRHVRVCSLPCNLRRAERLLFFLFHCVKLLCFGSRNLSLCSPLSPPPNSPSSTLLLPLVSPLPLHSHPTPLPASDAFLPNLPQKRTSER